MIRSSCDRHSTVEYRSTFTDEAKPGMIHY